ncbi:GNAT family N-acetyltransferase [Aureivirga marina]|uniref:GNAT family N-acetyltransferase n=1 Tax=Aureivirga marina TaxID=1182451 RepID=UPI0018C9BDA3|nr:GNAT family N-acetyltransferase [Aureivirga marina]
MSQSKIYETERLILRASNLSDVDLVINLLNTPKYIEFIGNRNINTTEQAEEHIKERMLHSYENFGTGNFTIIRKEDQKKIGSCGMYDREGVDGLDIGFAFLPEFEGKGYAFESAYKLKEIFVEKGLDKISAITLKENLSSRKLLEKLDLEFQEIIKIPNDDADLMLYVWEK